MPKLEYFLICESMSTDQETNRVSLFNVLEDLTVLGSEDAAQQQSYVTSSLMAVSCWNREPGDEDRDFQAALLIHAPGEKVTPFRMNFKMERPRQRLVFRFQGMPKLRPGELVFELQLDGEHIASHTVNVFSSPNAPSDTAESEA